MRSTHPYGQYSATPALYHKSGGQDGLTEMNTALADVAAGRVVKAVVWPLPLARSSSAQG